MSKRLYRSLLLAALVVVVATTTASAQTYWFEHYETAVSRIDSEQGMEASAALSMLDDLVREYPVPESKVRIPGDRYVDYLPYYQRARIQAMLGQFEEAQKSLDISEAFGAVKENRDAMAAVREMRGAMNRRAATP